MNRCDCWGPDGRFDTKINQIDRCHIYMSYASYVIVWQIMTYDAYDIEIWHRSYWWILVSKRPSEPQQSHPFIRFQWKICFKIKKIKNVSGIFSLYTFLKSFVFLCRTLLLLEKHFPQPPRDEPYVFGICSAIAHEE